jgi:hypothetical protein
LESPEGKTGMNINFEQLLYQFAALGVWVFICAGLYIVFEKVCERFFPGFLDIEEAGASQAPAPPIGTTDTKKA